MKQVQEFLESKGMNYEVLKEQATRTNGKGETVPIEGQFNLVRSTDEVVISPSTVSDRYSVTSPRKMCDPIAPLVAEGWIQPDTGFLFKGGSYEVVCFAMNPAELEDGGKIAGEDHKHWISLHNHQGGGGGLKGSITSFKVVCANTAAAAAREACFSIRHTGDIDTNYKWAIERWEKLKVGLKKLSDRMIRFEGLQLSSADALDAIYTLYGVQGVPTDDISTRTMNELEHVIFQFNNPKLGTFGKNGKDLYNAITATNTHYKPLNSKEDANKRLSSIYDANGSRFKLENETVSLLEEMVGV